MSRTGRGVPAPGAPPALWHHLELLQLLCLHLYLPGALLILLLQPLEGCFLVLGGLSIALHGGTELLPQPLHLPTQLQAAVLLLLQALGTESSGFPSALLTPKNLLDGASYSVGR